MHKLKSTSKFMPLYQLTIKKENECKREEKTGRGYLVRFNFFEE